MATRTAAQKTAHGVGVIRDIDAKQDTITLEHQAIREFGWPPMTMEFKVADAKPLAGRKVGEKIIF